MVQSVEHLGAKLEFHTLGYVKGFNEAQIEIPVTWSLENVAPGAIRSRHRYGERAGVLENDRTDHTRHFLQANLRFGADDIRTRLVREVRRSDAAADAERLAGHERVNSVEAPASDDMVQRRMNRRLEPFLSSNREFPQ